MEALKSIIDMERLLELQQEALKFTTDNISTDGEKNWETIYQLKLDLLKTEENAKNLIADYKKQIERLAQQIGRIAQGK